MMALDPPAGEASSVPITVPTDSRTNASTTEIKVQKVTHQWTVKNFSHCYQEYLENFVHLNKADEALTWSIKIYPKGNGENNKDFVFLCLNKMANPTSKLGKIGFKSKFTLKTAENKEIEMRIHPNPSHSDYVSYIKRDVLFPQINPQDIIIVQVEIDVAVETITTSTEDGIVSPNSSQQLVDDYQRLLKDEMFADFTIRVGAREARCHRSILAARSAVFAAMFAHDNTDESKTGVLDIKDLDFDVVTEMLAFIYCGRCPRGMAELADELLVAADKYRLTDLKTHCEKALIQQLTVDNSCELLILSDVHSALRLREKAVQFILQHPADVTTTTGWKLLLTQHQALITEIVSNFDKTSTTDGATFVGLS